MTRAASLRPAYLFLALVLVLSGAAQAVWLATGSLAALGAAAWAVAVAALAAVRLAREPLSSLGLGWGGWRHHLIAVLLPFVYAGLGYGGAALLGLVTFAAPGKIDAFVATTPLAGSLPVALALTLTVGLVGSALMSIGEETGWRGLLSPRLTARLGFVAATAITGLVWGVWHLPMILFGGYDGGGAPGPEIACFLVMTVTLSAPLAWLRLRSKSFLPCATLHGAHNLVTIGLFDRLIERGASELTLVGEFGLVSAAALAVVSLPFWIAGAKASKVQSVFGRGNRSHFRQTRSRAAGSGPSASPRSATGGRGSSCREAKPRGRP